MGFDCTTCGQYHDELPLCFGSPAPALWLQMSEAEREQRGQISSDQCIVDNEHYFILGRVMLPVVDGPESFCWLAWVSLSRENFRRASELWHTAGRESEPPYFGWLQSSLPYSQSTLSLRTRVLTQPLGERPLIELELAEHPLAIEQRQGITMARVREIVEAVLHG
ncbi:DUF2199 domain-containing protein [Steroidobacter sp.]|uniref:DUF2199 domain-containing protein n=1 Tax=Steroidobacter sp. TaxID=1978227 RepID=UPI001A6307C1|nr:DUF2199 domain-containing protein [Steroidobacter sp.]MBL8267522.1 DUF2199 domain-containing protein [Steroidobacter sp.]